MKVKNKSILDRETERLVKEQDDELELEITGAQVGQEEGDVAIDI